MVTATVTPISGASFESTLTDGSNLLTDYLRALLDDHVKLEEEHNLTPTWKQYRAEVAARLREIRPEYKPAVQKALRENADLPSEQRLSDKAVKAQVRRALIDREQNVWENANWEKAIADTNCPPQIDELLSPFAVAVSALVRWLDVPSIDEGQLREHLALGPWGGPTERTSLVAEFERLNREGYANLLAKLIQQKCPKGAARISRHPDDPTLPKVDLRLNQVRYAGECYDVSADGALLFHCLVDRYPDWFPAGSILTKPSAVKNSLPDPLKCLIETKKGHGYRLKIG